jgi:hypothetical protein
MTGTHSRRRFLSLVGGGAMGGVAGCLGRGGGEGCESGAVTLTDPDGTTHCVAPVESDESVASFYGFDSEGNRSANVPDELTANDATVAFVYRNESTDERSLVVVNGDPGSDADADGVAPLTFEGVADSQWLVQDGPPDAVPYATPDGSFDGPETALWNWPKDRTDGGAIGPLGETFDIEIRHRARATVDGTTMQRRGLDRWLFADGADPGSPIELARFDGDSGAVSAQLSTGDDS